MSAHDWYHGNDVKNIGMGFGRSDYSAFKNGVHVSPANRELIRNYQHAAERYQNVRGKDDLDNIGMGFGRSDYSAFKNGVHVSPANRELIRNYQHAAERYQH
jgi:hypothetical protein